MPLDRPIPALYCCYLLRSTVRHSSLYVGSTPNPVRRLRQHNGVAKGGAAKTSRDSLRPWEMAVIVSGFPSSIAALQFEWAWQNAHSTRHIPDNLRITLATKKKKSGQPRRPPYTWVSLLSNLHLLLRVPSFSRWPLEVRFFTPDAHKSWLQIGSQKDNKALDVITDFPPHLDGTIAENLYLGSASSQHFSAPVDNAPKSACHGIASMPVTYAPYKSYVEKAKNIIDFEQEGKCGVCDEELNHGEGIYTICPNLACNSVSHLSCLSKAFLDEEASKNKGWESGEIGELEQLVPISGTCKCCGQMVKWVDIVKEVTLRIRGPKTIKRLLNNPRRKGVGKSIAADSEVEDSDDLVDDSDEEDGKDNLCIDKYDAQSLAHVDNGDQWFTIDDSDDEMISIASTNSDFASPDRRSYRGRKEPDIVHEDDKWADALVLD